MNDLIDVPPGLAGVAVTATEIGDVLGQEGVYHYRGQLAVELARHSTFETVASLVLDGSGAPLVGDRSLPADVAALVDRLDLRSAMSVFGASLGLRPLIEITPEERVCDAARLISAMPTLVASILHRRPVPPDPLLGHVADFLRMVRGEPAPPEIVAAMEAFFVLTIDHGFSNSAFATRVVASSGADLAACVLAGFGSLTGPRHGADVERILDMFDAIDEPQRAEEWMKAEMAARRPLQGFGHSVYRTVDPRLTLLRDVGAAVNPERQVMAMAVEQAGTRLLAGRGVKPNLDLYSPVVLEGCGIPRGWFTAAFATARIVGLCAHAIEQATDPKILRPSAHYIGPPPNFMHN